ncbi:MAG: 23S rRNA (uracil(1939)-C(5))-methyltransferase RlmD [Oscillatoria sp. SIO1A7]|nr:23S rRNA (uracil(1939)-C(5))-methyltransferase RlmD [Oscillatoria sp. SIO1A7]
MSEQWQQGNLVEVAIADLSDSGDGVGRFGERVVFVPNTVPGDKILARLIRVKPKYALGKVQEILEPGSSRIRPNCIVADKCGGCQWQHIAYDLQLQAKKNLIVQALERIGNIDEPPVKPVLPARVPLGYRNKATYPLGLSNSGQVQAGYYQKGSHQLINLNRCPVQDDRLNPLLQEIKQDIQKRGWSIYNELLHSGEVRHLSLRIGRRTGEMLLTLVVRSGPMSPLPANLELNKLPLSGIEEQARQWLDRYPQLVGVCLNVNPARTNAIFGAKTFCIAGRPYLQELFAGLEFRLRPDTFFQVNTETAETLLEVILDRLDLQGNETSIDAYCGIGTFTLPLAKRVRQAIGFEVQLAAVEQARENASLLGLTNVRFEQGKAETLLLQLPQLAKIAQPDIVLLDPPRKGCAISCLDALLKIRPRHIVYISCQPATLARDLKILSQGGYRIDCVQPADFFPQTPHVESVAFLVFEEN